MRLRVLSILSVIALVLGVASIATAHHNDDHTQNHHGMCTAYFSGGENGQEKKRENGNSFGVFEEGIGDRDDDGDVDSYDVADFCLETTGGFGNPGGGNDPSFGGDDCGFEQERCDELDGHGGGTGDDGNNNNENPPGRS